MNENRNKKIKEQFVQEDFSLMHRHEVLEFLMFFTDSKDITNELAHKFDKHFDEMCDFFDADINYLTKTFEISKDIALLIKSIPEITNHYTTDDNPDIINNYKKSVIFFENKFKNHKQSDFMLVMLGNKSEILLTEFVSIHTDNKVFIDINKIVKLCIHHEATSLIIGFNKTPSSTLNEYKYTVKKVNEAIKFINAHISDFVIISEDRSYSAMNTTII